MGNVQVKYNVYMSCPHCAEGARIIAVELLPDDAAITERVRGHCDSYGPADEEADAEAAIEAAREVEAALARLGLD